MTEETIETRVRAHPFLAGLTDEQCGILAADGTPVEIPAGTRLFTEGDIADRFWLIEEGGIALDLVVPGRGEQVLEVLAAGTVLGWSWLQPPYQWHFGAVSRAATRAIAFDAASVRQRGDADPAFGYAILRAFIPVVVERLQASRLRLLDLYASPTQVRAPQAHLRPGQVRQGQVRS